MDFKKTYLQFIIVMTLVFLSGFMYFIHLNNTISNFDPAKLIVLISIMCSIVFGFFILINWINNTIALIFFKLKEYPIKTYNLYPLIIINLNRLFIYWFLNPFIELYTTVAVEKIKWDTSKLKKYHKDYISIITTLKKVNLVTFIILVLAGIFIDNIFLILGGVLLGNICLWNMPNCRIMLPGMYLALKDSTACMHMIFRMAKIEVFDKTLLYNYAQSQMKFDKKELVGAKQKLLEQIIIDSIYENKKYLIAEVEDIIYKLLVIQSGGKSPFYFKLMVLFAIYCLDKGEVRTAKLLYNEINSFCKDLQFCPNQFKKKYQNIAVDNKIINFDIKEIADFDNKFTTYGTKIKWFKEQTFEFN